ncbi:MAG: tetratricopeptide repeat protein [Proteobacteria bacterium]|jgi:tetratricopeptide (TPR) repeat protein|nr:tetratricopeptide repeat protein [Pseudomonadota bacterium]
MAKVSMETIEKYQEILRKDPHHRAFALLAEAYRELGLFSQAEKVARDGLRRHPHYVSGFVVLGRVLMDLENFIEGLKCFLKATELDPQNILAYHLAANCYLQLDDPKSALKFFKRVLFLNPQNEKAKKAIAKLESLTADEYEDDNFSMQKLSTPLSSAPIAGTQETSLERSLSLVEALIVRGDLDKAKKFLHPLLEKYPNHPQVLEKWALLEESERFEEEAEPLSPVASREKQILAKKTQFLENLLRGLKKVQEQRSPFSSIDPSGSL